MTITEQQMKKMTKRQIWERSERIEARAQQERDEMRQKLEVYESERNELDRVRLYCMHCNEPLAFRRRKKTQPYEFAAARCANCLPRHVTLRLALHAW